MKFDECMAALSEELEPIRRLAARLVVQGQKEVPHGIAISPRPLVAPEYHALQLFAGVPAQTIARYETRFLVAIPAVYKSVLTQISGLHAFELALFGIPNSLTLDPPVLDRSYVQPYDLATAENDWKRAYAVDRALFHFGSGPLTTDEHVGYFLANDGRIHGYRKNGHLFKSWDSLTVFLTDELARAEAEYPHFEAFMVDLQQLTQRLSRKKNI